VINKFEGLVACIDVGSNSLGLIVANYDPSSTKLKIFFRKTLTTRLAELIPAQGILFPAGLKLIQEELESFVKICHSYQIIPSQIKGVATEASRRCKGEAEIFFSLIKQKIGINIEIIPPQIESHLCAIALALTPVFVSDKQNKVYFDLGGASTEIRSNDHKHFLSAPFGSVIIQSSINTNSLGPNYIQDCFSQCEIFVKDSFVICSYGAINLLMQMLDQSSDLNEVSQHARKIICNEEFTQKLRTLRDSIHSSPETINKFRFLGNRSHSILGAINIFYEFLRVTSPRAIICSDYGLAEGLAMSGKLDLEQLTLIK
jgi:exopolyphosphatase/pppGpp-phosphohydrolase